MTSRHVTPDDLRRLRARELAPSETLDVLRHLAACADCARGDATAMADGLVANDDLHPSADVELVAYVDGTLDDDHRAAIADHLGECAVCREDVADLRSVRTDVQSSPRWWRYAAAAAVVGAIAATQMFRRDPPPPSGGTIAITTHPQPATTVVVPPRDPRHAEWDRIIDSAIAAGRLPRPAFIADLRGAADTVRGATGNARLTPAGECVTTQRPRFTWPSSEGASYQVTVWNGEEEIAKSPALRDSSWIPERDLPRAVTLTWQVEITRGSDVTVLPMRPDPPAKFRVITAGAAKEIGEARLMRPDDHLLLAVLLAREGVLREAQRELGKSGDQRAAKLR